MLGWFVSLIDKVLFTHPLYIATPLSWYYSYLYEFLNQITGLLSGKKLLTRILQAEEYQDHVQNQLLPRYLYCLGILTFIQIIISRLICTMYLYFTQIHSNLTESVDLAYQDVSKEIGLPNSKVLYNSLKAIHELKALIAALLLSAATIYDSKNTEHEKKLIELWQLLMPDERLENRISKQWQKIGFQGVDPATDFRGMGILGLDNLLFFAKMYTSLARSVVSSSNHPVHWYSFAIVGINITATLIKYLQSNREMQIYFYQFGCSRLDLNEFYCYVIYNFDKFWNEKKPENVLLFNQIYAEYLETLKSKLQRGERVKLE